MSTAAGSRFLSLGSSPHFEGRGHDHEHNRNLQGTALSEAPTRSGRAYVLTSAASTFRTQQGYRGSRRRLNLNIKLKLTAVGRRRPHRPRAHIQIAVNIIRVLRVRNRARVDTRQRPAISDPEHSNVLDRAGTLAWKNAAAAAITANTLGSFSRTWSSSQLICAGLAYRDTHSRARAFVTSEPIYAVEMKCTRVREKTARHRHNAIEH